MVIHWTRVKVGSYLLPRAHDSWIWQRSMGMIRYTQSVVSQKCSSTNQCEKEAFRQALEKCAPTVVEEIVILEEQGHQMKYEYNSNNRSFNFMRNAMKRSASTRKTSLSVKEEVITRATEITQQSLVVRTCLASASLYESTQHIHTGMHVAFLGTAAGHSTTMRNTSATALRCGGMTYLFDVGEGFHRQMQFSTLSLGEISKIFITHLHGDHIFGLPSLLLDLSTMRKMQIGKHRVKSNKVIAIYGPPGLYNYIAMNLVLSCCKFDTLHVVVHELTGGMDEKGPYHNHLRHNNRDNMKNPFTGHYSEISNCLPTIFRELMPMQPDGTWTIEEPCVITEDMVWHRHDLITKKNKGEFHGAAPRLPNETNAGPKKQMLIKASQVRHMPGIQTFGYVLEESPPPPKIDPKKAIELGLSPGPKYTILKNGFSVKSDNGLNDIYPNQVLVVPAEQQQQQQERGRKFALLGDNYSVPAPMVQLCMDADLVVHEATFVNKKENENIHGHSTAKMAGKFAHCVNAKVLILNHFGAATGDHSLALALSEARKGNKDTSQIIASNDFMEVLIPPGGFDFPGGKET